MKQVDRRPTRVHKPLQHNLGVIIAGICSERLLSRTGGCFSIDAITGFSVIPLRIASGLGMLCGLTGLVGLTYALGSWIAGVTVPGWTSVVIIVLILGSVQLMVLGIFGEYLGRLYMESKHRPLFIIDQVVGQSATVKVGEPTHKDGPS